TIDYVVTKVPRFAFEKFPAANDRLTTQMKSVGEVMAIGRTFQESLQKALRGLETGHNGLNETGVGIEQLRHEIAVPGPERIFFLADGIRAGMTDEELHELSAIDPWFLNQVREIVETEDKLRGNPLSAFTKSDMLFLKRKGFSDGRLAQLTGAKEAEVRAARLAMGIRPVYKRVDTCAAEFATNTAYLYSTYEEECEAEPTDRRKVMVLGGGPNRIGQGIEFDYCCVHASKALRADGWETIMVNCNPETVSTDFDTSDRLYFEPVTLEDVLAICEVEKPAGVIVQYGGQTPLKLCRALEAAGVPIIGTTPDAIDCAEDRERFQHLLQKLNLRQPPNRTARTEEDAIRLAAEIGYPLVVRPSYVLGGRAMDIVHTPEALQRYMKEAVSVSNESPVLLDRFLDDAVEMDVDAVADGHEVQVAGVMEHIEQAGVHSGDSACSLPPYSLPAVVVEEIKRQTKLMAEALNVVGLMNVQFAVQHAHSENPVIYVLEVNPRASRTVPFVSKATGNPVAAIAARVMAGQTLAEQGVNLEVTPRYVSVKEAVFPFSKFLGVDPVLGPEMRSTGEVMGVGRDFGEALFKSQLAAGSRLPERGSVFIS
ncbi:MAG: carbamoyl-phosphate synthase large subunit, partial [Sutterella wadsworthensis]